MAQALAATAGAAVPPAARPALDRLVSALLVLALAAATSRLFIDEGVINAPAWAWVPLVAAAGWVAWTLGAPIALTAWIMVPGFFGATPWNSPVRASFGGPDLPLFVFDLSLVATAAWAVASGLRRPDGAAGRLLRDCGALFALVAVMLVVKVLQGGASAETLRNAALFFYGPAVALTAMLVAQRLPLEQLIPLAYLRLMPLLTLVPALVLVAIALGLRDWVLVDLGRQDLIRPVGVLDWMPPGSLVLVGYCAAAFLPDRRTPWTWKLPLLLLLAYDASTYLNRALWIGIGAGITLHWALLRGWWRGLLPLLLALALASLSLETLRDRIGEGHNQSSEWRLLAWTLTGLSILDQPLLGHDYGESLLGQVLVLPESVQSMQEAELRIDPQARSPHNSYLSLLFFGGLVQGGAVIGIIGWSLVRLARAITALARRGRRHPMADAVLRGAVAIVVYSGFNVVLETPIEGIAFWAALVPVWLWGTRLRAELKALAPA